MDNVRAVNILEGIEPMEYDGQDVEALQYLIDNRVINELQGSLLRMAHEAVRAGVCVVRERIAFQIV